MTGRLDRRVEEALADIVKITALEEVLAQNLFGVWDDDANNAARLQDSVTLSEENLPFLVVEVL